MFDQVHRGWLDSDDYRVAARAAGVVELPEGSQTGRLACDPQPTGPCPTASNVLDDLLSQRWTDRDPGSVGK